MCLPIWALCMMPLDCWKGELLQQADNYVICWSGALGWRDFHNYWSDQRGNNKLSCLGWMVGCIGWSIPWSPTMPVPLAVAMKVQGALRSFLVLHLLQLVYMNCTLLRTKRKMHSKCKQGLWWSILSGSIISIFMLTYRSHSKISTIKAHYSNNQE